MTHLGRGFRFGACAFALLAMGGCQLLIPKQLRSNPPPCASYKYSAFMGQSKAWVQAQSIPERHSFTGAGEPAPEAADPTRIMFFLEGTPPVVAGLGCN